MDKLNASGKTVSIGVCLVYVSSALVFLNWFGRSSGFDGGLSAVDPGSIMAYYMLAMLAIFGGLMLVAVLYRLDSLMRKPAPEWVYGVLALAVPAVIYFGMPPLPEWR